MGDDEKIYTITFGGNESQLRIEIAGNQDISDDLFWKMIKGQFINYVTGVHPRVKEMTEAIDYMKARLTAAEFSKLKEKLEDIHKP